MTLPLVSVVCPTFSRPELLRRAVEIFLAYRYPAKEMVIVDDSPAPARIQRSTLIRYVHLPERMVLGAKHNLAASLAQGDIIAHQDDDDVFSPMRLSLQVESLIGGGVDLCGFPVVYVREESTGNFYRFKQGVRFVPAPPFKGPLPFSFHDSTAAFTRRVWGAGIQYTNLPIAQKVHMINDAVRAGFRTKTLPNVGVFVYSRHGVNTWQFSLDFLAPAAPPSFVRDAWFARLVGRAA